jgi:hypothetical protein
MSEPATVADMLPRMAASMPDATAIWFPTDRRDIEGPAVLQNRTALAGSDHLVVDVFDARGDKVVGPAGRAVTHRDRVTAVHQRPGPGRTPEPLRASA